MRFGQRGHQSALGHVVRRAQLARADPLADGVMGGADSEISSSTRTVAFESAYFKATSVRRTSKRLGLKTEASSYAEVVKNALRLYEALIEETESGKQFFVRDENGAMIPYRLFL